MKAILCFALLAAVCFAADVVRVNETSPNFILGTWYSNGTIPADLTSTACCAPTGTVWIYSDATNASQVLLNATAWNGTICAGLGINENYTLHIPFVNTSSYAQINTYDNLLNDINATFSVSAFTDANFTNGTQFLTVELELDYFFTQGVDGTFCYVTLSKSASMIKVAGAALVALVAFFAF